MRSCSATIHSLCTRKIPRATSHLIGT
ncbi:RNA polymerase sigma factor [Vibrio splendidus 12B01]|nr:RNA polymerase sigma factor [Vibrio splendidus 12B01]